MWLSIRIEDFAITNRGFTPRPSGTGCMYLSPGLDIEEITDLRHAEYGQAIYVDTGSRTVKFGRDYLGHYPLLYACTSKYLFISDHIGEIRRALKREGVQLSVSEESVALYLVMGYIPQGMTLYEQIIACENATIYTLRNGRVSTQRIFEPIEIRPDITDNELHEAIISSVTAYSKGSEVDVWCSGGLDSSSMAWEACRATKSTELLTLRYGNNIERKYGEGEVPFARLMAKACDATLRETHLNDKTYQRVYSDFLDSNIGPVVDTCAIAKYALAEASRSKVLTGEGGDPLFGGVKNDFVMFTMTRNPHHDIGLVYAQSHHRCYEDLALMQRGSELKGFAADYMRKLLDKYPGDLLRKLFYTNTFEKQGSMIFAENYYPGQKYGVAIRHPLSSLAVYEMAFARPDSSRYVYPTGKLPLLRLYQNRLPDEITNRKKSGTLVPLRHFLTNLPEEYYDLSNLHGLSMFRGTDVQSQFNFVNIVNRALLIHAIITLNAYIHKAELNDELLSSKSHSHNEPSTSSAV